MKRLILIDEWVTYARGLHDTKDLTGGDFETQFTFAQTLTEEVKGASGLPKLMQSKEVLPLQIRKRLSQVFD